MERAIPPCPHHLLRQLFATEFREREFPLLRPSVLPEPPFPSEKTSERAGSRFQPNSSPICGCAVSGKFGSNSRVEGGKKGPAGEIRKRKEREGESTRIIPIVEIPGGNSYHEDADHGAPGEKSQPRKAMENEKDRDEGGPGL